MRKSLRRLTWVLLALGVFIVLSPIFFCGWTLIGYPFFYRVTLPTYPGAQEIGVTRSVEHANSSAETRYLWSEASFEDIRSYYENLTLPVVTPQYGLNAESRQYYRTVFNPLGGVVPIVTAEFGGEIKNASSSLYCYYRLKYECVQIEVIDFGDSDPVRLPQSSAQFAPSRTLEPPQLRGGRLIIYIYLIDGA